MKKEQQIKLHKKADSGLPQIDPNSINQTIIINNPNININYIENQHGSKMVNHQTIIGTTLYNQKNDTKGLDTWNLNKNLKQFSQTRQLGFYKNGKNQHKSISPNPYLITKSKTQDIRNNGKIINQLNSFRENKTVKKQIVPQLEKEPEHSSSKTTFRTKQYAYKKSKNTIEESGSKIQFYPPTKSNEPNKATFKEKLKLISERKKGLQVRKNRFERVQTPSISSNSEKNIQQQLIIGQEQKTIDYQQIKSPKRIIQKSIQKVSHLFLKQVDNYFDNIDSIDIPSSKIQEKTSTIIQPLSHRNTIEYRSHIADQAEIYDFGFEDDKLRKRPKTPYKRKKFYEE